MLNIIFLVIAIAGGGRALMFKYEVEISKEEILLPCEEYPDNFFDKFLTFPENMTLLPDDTLYISGDMVLTFDFEPTKKYPLDIEFFKWQRGAWQKTTYTIIRDDYCTSLFDPTEPWRPFVGNFNADQRVCPFKKGQVFSFKNYVTDKEFDLPFKSLEGEYWVRYTVGKSSDLSDYLCANIYLTLYRL